LAAKVKLTRGDLLKHPHLAKLLGQPPLSSTQPPSSSNQPTTRAPMPGCSTDKVEIAGLWFCVGICVMGLLQVI